MKETGAAPSSSARQAATQVRRQLGVVFKEVPAHRNHQNRPPGKITQSPNGLLAEFGNFKQIAFDCPALASSSGNPSTTSHVLAGISSAMEVEIATRGGNQ